MIVLVIHDDGFRELVRGETWADITEQVNCVACRSDKRSLAQCEYEIQQLIRILESIVHEKDQLLTARAESQMLEEQLSVAIASALAKQQMQEESEDEANAT